MKIRLWVYRKVNKKLFTNRQKILFLKQRSQLINVVNKEPFAYNRLKIMAYKRWKAY